MMANSMVQPFTGPLTVDLQHLDGIVVDAAEGAMRGARREKEGVDKTLKELDGSIPKHSSAIGLAPDVLTRIQTATERLASVRAARIIVGKLVEVLEETQICLEDEREGDIGLVVGAVRRTGTREPGVLVHFEETIRYHGQIGVRAAKARRRALEEAAEEDEAETPTGPAPLAG